MGRERALSLSSTLTDCLLGARPTPNAQSSTPGVEKIAFVACFRGHFLFSLSELVGNVPAL